VRAARRRAWGHHRGRRAARRQGREPADLRERRGEVRHSLLDSGGGALVVSNFTLIADTTKGNRPSFSDSAPPEEAEPLYEAFCSALRALGVEVAAGVFGARMAVELVNDGPVTIVL
jgi:D-tyrosyl-tRNA(Tyr) deacylase